MPKGGGPLVAYRGPFLHFPATLFVAKNGGDKLGDLYHVSCSMLVRLHCQIASSKNLHHLVNIIGGCCSLIVVRLLFYCAQFPQHTSGDRQTSVQILVCRLQIIDIANSKELVHSSYNCPPIELRNRPWPNKEPSRKGS